MVEATNGTGKVGFEVLEGEKTVLGAEEVRTRVGEITVGAREIMVEAGETTQGGSVVGRTTEMKTQISLRHQPGAMLVSMHPI